MKRTFLLILLTCLTTSILFAQQRGERRPSGYQALLMRTDRPHAYFDHAIFPASDSTAQFVFLFRLDYDFVPFLKKNNNMKAPTPELEYYAPVQIGLEVYDGEAPRSRRASDIANSIFRDSWQDTLWVDSYDKTTSRTVYVQGVLHTSLESGEYHYQAQLPRTNTPAVAGERSPRNISNDMPAPRQNITIAGNEDADKADFILLENFQRGENSLSGTFLNFGDNIMYGQDYTVLVRIPDDADSESLELNLHRITGGAGSDSEELRYSEEITPGLTVHFNEVNLTSSSNEVGFEAEITDKGATYASVVIPNHNFENSIYRLSLNNSESDKMIGEKRIQSQWLDMPVSLYNLDVAIDMLHFIVSDQKLEQINSGSDSEREKKFREFWAQRDPTPGTEFNELMTEYYNRIDYSYDEFSSYQVPGFQTDQGRAYILYGPPDNVERRLPTNAPTREIWTYPDKTLIFEATTGFGDFKLISEQQS